ncbi:hypothetical protein AAFF_G00259980 [Aldrovandia affinis]|uniref:Uncharacterized protein n=1 Tax=Aldrovandia affinis TaxID=143900 RepID=A0AAD7RCA6_9TELE|nr:hypothetical protein AAFF_G00259980 [Aldrovandia affinis]
MKDMGNPFQEESRDLLSLDTKDIAHHTAAELIGTHLEKSKVRFQEFMKGLEGEEESTFYEPIKKNRVDFFRHVPASVDSSKQKVLKEDCQLFSKLFISCQSRECDLKEFFRHENQSHPAALSDGGKLHTCQKSHLTTILESQVTTPEAEPDADTIIIDGAALVNSLPPRSSKTFKKKSKGMLFFHAFTGCDVISAFRGKGKKSAWQTCDVCDEASGVFSKLSQYPPSSLVSW